MAWCGISPGMSTLLAMHPFCCLWIVVAVLLLLMMVMKPLLHLLCHQNAACLLFDLLWQPAAVTHELSTCCYEQEYASLKDTVL